MKTRKILLIGCNGQLGWELQRTCSTLGDLIGIDYPDIDLGQLQMVRTLIREVNPSLIINAAAYTNVDKAESEPEIARRVNGLAPGVIAEEARRLRAAFVHYSTDYVFDGDKGSSYIESDLPNPINMYGTTKLEGEQVIQAVGGASLIFRTSWVYSMRQGGFVSKVLKWVHEQPVLRIVDDQIGSPTWARMLAEATSQVVAQGRSEIFYYFKEKTGIYHLAGSGACSRYAWAKEILRLCQQGQQQPMTEIIPTKSSEFPLPATRPLNTSLANTHFEKSFELNIPSWSTTLRDCFGM